MNLKLATEVTWTHITSTISIKKYIEPSKYKNKTKKKVIRTKTKSKTAGDENATKAITASKTTRTRTANDQGVVTNRGNTDSATMIILGGPPYNKINCLLMLRLFKILETNECKEKSKIGYFDHVKAISWNCQSRSPQTHRIFNRIPDKENTRTTTLEGQRLWMKMTRGYWNFGQSKRPRSSVQSFLWRRTRLVTDMLDRPSKWRWQINYARSNYWTQEATLKSG